MIHKYNCLLKTGLLFSFVLLTAALSACDKNKNDKNKQGPQVITVQSQAAPTILHYSGTIDPIRTLSVTSPTDGTVQKINFSYGHWVDKGQLLAIVNSQKLQKDYQDALTGFLKAKDEYERGKASFAGTAALWKAGIIDDETYNGDKSTLATNELTYISAQQTLASAAKTLPGGADTIKNLSLSDIDTVKKILMQSIENISLKAPASGIALFPLKSSDQDSDSGKTVHPGDEVKQGQLIVSIGDLSGISVKIAIGELNIDRIKPGQKVTVTTPVLENTELQGTVSSVAAQAQTSEGDSSLPTFNANVVVSTLTSEQQALLRIGMGAEVNVTLENPPQIMIPIKAVHSQNGQSVVFVIDPKSGQQQTVPVITGGTTLDQVTITSGLKPGDKVVVGD